MYVNVRKKCRITWNEQSKASSVSSQIFAKWRKSFVCFYEMEKISKKKELVMKMSAYVEVMKSKFSRLNLF